MDEIWMLWLFFCPFGGGCRMGAIAGNSPTESGCVNGRGTIWETPGVRNPPRGNPSGLCRVGYRYFNRWTRLEMDRVFPGKQPKRRGEQVLYWRPTGWSPCRSGKGFVPLLQAKP